MTFSLARRRYTTKPRPRFEVPKYYNKAGLTVKSFFKLTKSITLYICDYIFITKQKYVIFYRKLSLLQRIRIQRELLKTLLQSTQVRLVVFGLGITVLVGTAGYMLIEGWNIIDALYMTVITLTTVGFGEIRPLSESGRIFTIGLILAGVGLITYGLSSAIEYVATGEVARVIKARRQYERLMAMRDHFIVIGYGRVGREVATTFAEANVPFVVIDSNPAAIERATEEGYVCVQGSGTDDEILLEAGIERARGLVACAGNDATNVFAVLTARALNDRLQIIARAIDEQSESKIIRAGANRVISPYVLGGRRMANLAMRPHVVDFLDITSQASGQEQILEEVVIEENSALTNQTIAEVDLRRRTGANILALYLPDGQWISNPSPSMVLMPGTRLILLGNRQQLNETEELARAHTSSSLP